MGKASVKSEPMDLSLLPSSNVPNEPMDANTKEDRANEAVKDTVEVAEMSISNSGIMHARDEALLRSIGLTDMVRLYLALLADNVVPGGFLSEFVSLESSMRRSSERRIRMAVNLTDTEPERLPAVEKQRKLHEKLIFRQW